MLKLNEITLDLRADYTRLARGLQLSYYRFATIFMSRDCTHYKYADVDGALCIVSLPPEKAPYCMFPLGAADLGRTIAKLRDGLGDFTFIPLSPQMKASVEQACPGMFHFTSQRSHFDYVYDTQSLINLTGKAYHAKRNFVNRFTSRYAYEYISLNPSNISICFPLMEKWFSEHPEYKSEMFNERQALFELIRNFDALALKGAAISVEGDVAGFTFGELMEPDTAHILVEKGNTDYPGIYPVINREFLSHEWAETQFVNRQEDMGLEGLRKAKESYHPVRMNEIYEGRLA